MAVDKIYKAVKEINAAADEVFLLADPSETEYDVGADAVVIASMLKLVVAQLGMIALAIAEKK